MRRIKINDKAHKYIKHIAKVRKETIPNTIDFIIDVFQQIPIHAVTVVPALEKHRSSMTYKIAFYEQNKHKLEEHQRKFFEQSKKDMRIFYEQNKKELLSFKAVYALTRKKGSKEKLKKYNQQYYIKRRG